MTYTGTGVLFFAILTLVLGGCFWQGSEAAPTPAPPASTATATPTDTPATSPPPTLPPPPPPTGQLTLLISDEENAIADFENLFVTFNMVRLNPIGAPPLDISITEEVDLVSLQGDMAKEILTTDVPVGNYSGMHLFVSETEGVWASTSSTSFAFTDIKVPSNKLQLNVAFEVKVDEPVTFVYDITVVRKGNEKNPQGYNLLPVIGESGPGQPFVEDKGLVITLPEDPTAGATSTVMVLRALQGGNVALNVDLSGTTDNDGKVNIQLGAAAATSTILGLDGTGAAATSTPITVHLEVAGSTDDDGELTVLVPDPAATSTIMVLNVATSTPVTLVMRVAGTTDSDGKLIIQVSGDPAATSTVMVLDSGGQPVANAEVTVEVNVGGTTDATGKLTFRIGTDPPPNVTFVVTVMVPAKGASVQVNGVTAGTTDAEGKLVITVPGDAEELEIEAVLGALEGTLKVTLE